MRQRIRFLAVLALCVGAAGCDENLSNFAGPTPNLDATFTSIQRDIFESTDAAGRSSCVTCHTTQGRTPAGRLSLENAVAYDNLVNVASFQRPDLVRVSPGDPDASYLVHKIDGRSGIVGRRMPFNGPPYLTDNQIAILERWVELGAPRN